MEFYFLRFPDLRRRIAVHALAAFLLARIASVGAEPTPAAPSAAQKAPAGGPQIHFVQPYFDFGRVPSGTIVTNAFVFKNVGDQVLEISEVRSACGCAAVESFDRRVKPGESGTIPVVFDSSKSSGISTKPITVISTDTNQPSVVLYIRAAVYKPIDALPTVAAFSFGPDLQTNATKVIRLINNLDEPVTLSPPVCTNRAFRAELKTIQEGKEFEMLVTVQPPLPPGALTAVITLKSSSPKMPMVSVNAYAVVQPAVKISPPLLTLQPGPVAKLTTFSVSIQNQSTNALSLSNPAVNADGIEVKLVEVKPGQRFNLEVTVPAGFQAPRGKAIAVALKCNHLQSPVVKIPIVQMIEEEELVPEADKANGSASVSDHAPSATTAARDLQFRH